MDRGEQVIFDNANKRLTNQTQMQQDYLKRTAKKAAAEYSAAADLTSPASVTASGRSNVRYMPHKRATVGSVVDNAGEEVLDDRVIMYIHGMSIT